MDWTRGQVIGHGSSATVFLATCPHSGDLLAVKSAELFKSESLQREQQILSSLASPHVVGYRGFDVSRETRGELVYNLFMEYAPTGSLADAIRRQGGRLEEPLIRFYTRQILQGLQYIHSKGLVHCDIKSRNVLVGRDGAKIADFGCATWGSRTAAIGGTPLFMPPEAARGEEQGFPSDIWALGCTIIEMATGDSPWPKMADPVSALFRIGHSGELPEIPVNLPDEGKDFLGKCLRRNPRERWTANQLLKHRFAEELNSGVKVIPEVYSDSPTSILDRGIWSSMEETTQPDRNSVQTSPKKWPAEQIRRLAMVSEEPRWREEERWMTIRRHDIGKSEELVGGGIMGGSAEVCGNNDMEERGRGGGSGGKEWLAVAFVDNNVSCRISRSCSHLADHSCRKTSVVHNYLSSHSHSHSHTGHTHTHTHKDTPHFASLLPTLL